MRLSFSNIFSIFYELKRPHLETFVIGFKRYLIFDYQKNQKLINKLLLIDQLDLLVVDDYEELYRFDAGELFGDLIIVIIWNQERRLNNVKKLI